MRRPFFAFFAAAVSCALAIAAACSGGKDKPGTLNQDDEGGVVPRPDTGPEPVEAGEAGDAETDADAGDLYSCHNRIKDGFETDTDCGGNQCKPCIDGKACVANTDCAGVFCDLTKKKCSTPACSDLKKNGDETDVDCGGKVCARCTFGKSCSADDDCLSSKCDGTTKLCSCPERMVIVPTSAALGGAYCIDDTEVPYGEYDRFVKANQPISTQSALCSAINTSFVPSDNWPPKQPFSIGYPYPVRNVDWCDALAYCTWAGKQLCGKISGGANLIADRNKADKSAWYNACSAQGSNVYPYGSTFKQYLCMESVSCLKKDGGGPNDDGGFDAGVYPACEPRKEPGPTAVCEYADTGAFSGINLEQRGCQGGVTSLYHMSGNVAEWEDSCEDADADAGTGGGTTDGGGAPDAGSASCLLRGGSYTSSTEDDVKCTAQKQVPRMTRADDIGFRCCTY